MKWSTQEFAAFLQWLSVELDLIVKAGGNVYDAFSAAILRWKHVRGPHQTILHAISRHASGPSEWLALVEALAAASNRPPSDPANFKRMIQIELRISVHRDRPFR